MALYSGIDLHGNNNVTLVMDEHDRVIFHKRLPNQLATILEQLAPYRREVHTLLPDEDQALAVVSALRVTACLAEQIKRVEKHVQIEFGDASVVSHQGNGAWGSHDICDDHDWTRQGTEGFLGHSGARGRGLARKRDLKEP